MNAELVALLASNCVGAYGLGGLANKILDLISQHEQQPPPDEAAAKADEPVVVFVPTGELRIPQPGEYFARADGRMDLLPAGIQAGLVVPIYRRLEISREQWDENEQLRTAWLNEGRSADGWKLRHDNVKAELSAERKAREKATAQLASEVAQLRAQVAEYVQHIKALGSQLSAEREAREKATAQLALAMERLRLMPLPVGHLEAWQTRLDGLDDPAAQELLEKARRCEEAETNLERIHKAHWDAVKLLTDEKE